MSRKTLFLVAAAVLALAFVSGALVYRNHEAQAARQVALKNQASLLREHAPTLGKPDARVHIVEFLDPACGTCAAFYPEVKRLMAANPDRIRLTVRHVPFHRGADLPVRILEASRNQGRYWQALEALLANQQAWVVDHAVDARRVWPALARAGLDAERIAIDVTAAEIARRMEQDMADARALGVTKTPTYYVNGRPLPRFGLQELQDLVREELRAAY